MDLDDDGGDDDDDDDGDRDDEKDDRDAPNSSAIVVGAFSFHKLNSVMDRSVRCPFNPAGWTQVIRL